MEERRRHGGSFSSATWCRGWKAGTYEGRARRRAGRREEVVVEVEVEGRVVAAGG